MVAVVPRQDGQLTGLHSPLDRFHLDVPGNIICCVGFLQRPADLEQIRSAVASAGDAYPVLRYIVQAQQASSIVLNSAVPVDTCITAIRCPSINTVNDYLSIAAELCTDGFAAPGPL